MWPEDGTLEALAERIAAKLAERISDDKRLLTRPMLAERLGISERGVTGLANRGELPAGFLIGGVRRWDWSEVLRHLGGRQHRRPRRGRGRHRRGN